MLGGTASRPGRIQSWDSSASGSYMGCSNAGRGHDRLQRVSGLPQDARRDLDALTQARAHRDSRVEGRDDRRVERGQVRGHDRWSRQRSRLILNGLRRRVLEAARRGQPRGVGPPGGRRHPSRDPAWSDVVLGRLEAGRDGGARHRVRGEDAERDRPAGGDGEPGPEPTSPLSPPRSRPADGARGSRHARSASSHAVRRHHRAGQRPVGGAGEMLAPVHPRENRRRHEAPPGAPAVAPRGRAAGRRDGTDPGARRQRWRSAAGAPAR